MNADLCWLKSVIYRSGASLCCVIPWCIQCPKSNSGRLHNISQMISGPCISRNISLKIPRFLGQFWLWNCRRGLIYSTNVRLWSFSNQYTPQWWVHFNTIIPCTLSNTPFILGSSSGHWQGKVKDRHLLPPPTWNLEKAAIEKIKKKR
jgi:hypothetical protein